MFRIIFIAQNYELVIVSPDHNHEAFLRWAAWEINGFQPFTFHEISSSEAQAYSSGQADGLGWETLPEQTFDTLDQVTRFILSKRLGPGPKRYFLDQDNSCHWYLVDASKREEWDKWVTLDEDDPAGWDSPDFAEMIDGHPNQVEFEAPNSIP